MLLQDPPLVGSPRLVVLPVQTTPVPVMAEGVDGPGLTFTVTTVDAVAIPSVTLIVKASVPV